DTSNDDFGGLVMARSHTDSARHFAKEHDMYGPIQKLITFIADQVVLEASSVKGCKSVRRLLRFNQKTDRKPVGSDDDKRPDVTLTFSLPPDSTLHDSDAKTIYSGDDDKKDAHPDYGDMLCVIEVKPDKSKQKDAFAQAYMYTRNIYACQHNRQFVWALTVCDSIWRICLFTHDNMFVSDELDTTHRDGRSALVDFVVRASFCDIYHLGYDPTIRYNPDIRKWQIDVFDNDMAEPKTLVIDSVLHNATRTTGRHTRCYIGIDPDSNERLLVKDAWAEETKRPEIIEAGSEGDTPPVDIQFERDEISLLKEVHNGLKDDQFFKGHYPELKYGGVVRQSLTSCQSSAMDTTYTAFAKIGEALHSDDIPYRIHKRLASAPIAESLRNLRSVDDYIVVMADVMITLLTISDNCGILHRDISSNNIMFTRDDNGTVRGFLNDFDCAIKPSTDRKVRTTMTGTLPFMSIGNLEAQDVPQTILNDLESCIYHMCWFGVEGVCSLHERGPVDDGLPHLDKWRKGTPREVANVKKLHMNVESQFQSNVT
ncbi:hypothetical protein LPJ75_004675, partial [Coemansia sp. RSA 2598]